VDPRTGLDDVEKRKFSTLPGLELRLLGRPARSQSVHRLRYPGALHLKEGRCNIFFWYSLQKVCNNEAGSSGVGRTLCISKHVQMSEALLMHDQRGYILRTGGQTKMSSCVWVACWGGDCSRTRAKG
jgi:hypothetical protein